MRYTHNVPDHAQDDPKAAHSTHRPCDDQRTALGKLDDSACEKGGLSKVQPDEIYNWAINTLASEPYAAVLLGEVEAAVRFRQLRALSRSRWLRSA